MIAIAAVLIGGLVGWIESRRAGEVAQAVPARSENAPVSRIAAAEGRSSKRSIPSSPPLVPVPSGTNASQTNQLPGESGTPIEWKSQLERILTAEGADVEKARKIAGIFPLLPHEIQVEAAEHLIDLVPDAEYGLVNQIVTNASHSAAALDTIMTDLLARPEKLMLPLYLQVARIPAHPSAEEAKDILELYLETDYGSDWTKWEKATDEWLKNNAQ